MCSITGIFIFRDNKPNSYNLIELVLSALESLKTRGPDESAIEIADKNCVMGGNRLIIRGGLGEGSMPFKYKGNICFYNGEIYNFAQKNIFSDGEVLLPLYEKLGLDIFNKLDGEFAISIWDSKRKILILARDHFGTKPIYFSLNSKRLLWGSSATAINKMEQHNFCSSFKSPVYKHTYSVQEPYTSFSGIWMVPPGHCLIVSDSCVKLICYNIWEESDLNNTNLEFLFEEIDKSLKTRLEYNGAIGIPMSSGVDSGIISFKADKMNVNYHIFSVIEMFGKKTEEADYIIERLERLKNVKSITLLKCNEEEYRKALNEIYLPTYYDSEKFDNGIIPMHTVFNAMKKSNIRVAIDGSGGDELFHGYEFRNDFYPVKEWPLWWKRCRFFYSVFTSLLDYTAKSDRAGAHFSIEARYPFQSVNLMRIALTLSVTDKLKWPLRSYLMQRLDYGKPMKTDLYKKFGFSLKNKDKHEMISDMKKTWCRINGLAELPQTLPKPFPFQIGCK